MWPYTRSLIKFFSSPEFVRFFAVGASAFIVDFSLLNIQIYIFHFNPFVGIISIANLISIIVAIVYGFILQRIWAFKRRDQSMVRQGSKYVGVSLFSLCVNSVLYGVLVAVGIVPPIAKIVVTSGQMVWSYLLYKYFVFKIRDN